jgi:hypothetical protein
VAVVTPRPKVDRMLSDADVTALRAVYDKTSSRIVKNAILETIGSSETTGGDQWLMSIVRNPNEETRYRQAAMSRLRRPDVSLDELGKLYDGLSERELRGEIIRIMGPARGARRDRQAARHRAHRDRPQPPPGRDQRSRQKERSPHDQAAARAGGEMTMAHRPFLLLLAGLACAPAAGAQNIASRISSQRDGYVGIAYASRADVCGHGTNYIRIGNGTFLGGGTWVTTDGDSNDFGDCERGPVRVLITRAEGRTVGLKVGVAGGPWPSGTTDLGR